MKLAAQPWMQLAGTRRVLAALPGARFVGGAVRDGLLGLPVTDVDVATQLAPATVVERLNAKLRGDLRRPLGARIEEPDEARAGQVPQDADVMEAERAGADDADPCRSAVQMMTPRSLPSRKRRK